MTIKSPKKVKQQERVLLLSLYLLKNCFGEYKPIKRKVLRFIENQKLMYIPDEDLLMSSAHEPIWHNDLAWKRENLKQRGLLQQSEHGVWQINEHGEQNVEAWAKRVKEMSEKRPDWVADFKAHSDPKAEFDDDFHYEYYITEETIRWGLKIAALRE